MLLPQRIRLSRRAIALSLFAALLACGARQHEPPHNADAVLLAGAPSDAPATSDALRAARALTTHVVIVSIDGLRPDAIDRFGAVTLARLKREGRFAERARTILPSTTIPSHASMLTGVGPMGHHVLWNDDDADNDPPATPTIFAYVKREGLSTAAFFSKSKFRYLVPAGSLDSMAAPARAEGIWPGELTASVTARYLGTASPNLLFVHLADVDYAGHSEGWMSAEYGDAVRTADRAVARLLARADSTFGANRYTVIITADHGGHGRTHGSARLEDVTIPWIVWGEGIATSRGAPMADPVRTMDTAATALWLLGIEVPRGLEGHAITTAFSR